MPLSPSKEEAAHSRRSHNKRVVMEEKTTKDMTPKDHFLKEKDERVETKL